MSAQVAKISQSAVWDTADKFLRNVVDPEDYGEYILPFLILRRLECLLDDTKDEVVELAESGKYNGEMLNMAVHAKFGLGYYNTSRFTMETIGKTDDHVQESLLEYLDGFSEHIADIWESFKFREKIATLSKNNRLWQVIRHFAALELHPDRIPDVSMGDLFEDIMYRAFTTKGKAAGAFYTPRDAIRLMVDVLFASDDEGLTGKAPARSVYDPTAGTGGMLLVAERALKEMNPNIDVSMYGQEMMDLAYAIGKADLLIQGGRPESIKQGDTLREDRYEGDTFDYVLSNPPFGSDWSVSKVEVMRQAAVPGSRFSHGLPATSDGQMLFLSHVASKMAPRGANGAGGRAAVVSNGSPLFTGKAESGPDRIRAWLLTSDLVDAIIALPEKMFYGTGISTYVWILDNNKEEHRKGKIQLINAAPFWSPMRKGMGDKTREMSESNRAAVLDLYTAFEDGEHCKIVTADDLGYRDVPVVKQHHYCTKVTAEAIEQVLSHPAATDDHRGIIEKLDGVVWNSLPTLLKTRSKSAGVKMPTGLIDAIMNAVAHDDPDAPPAVSRTGKPVLVDGFSMTERIPLSEDVDEHMRREVLPFAPDVTWDEAASKVGYEIPFTRLFYKPVPVRPLEDIDADIARVMASLEAKFAAVRE
ncbi:class I SAM-dependent DNA methyltransferase [Dietzia sp. WMMA184]|uniref:type I restriction-modification system subunit M n=1 Tax=Dietzia sp. WMMA184 TaxID=2039808 RepID=UPI000BDEED04|nr:class I SAM-dependent DNA methyltransferase [Dietzia sp. WMMA184]